MILKITMLANMTSPLQTHSFQIKPWMKKKKKKAKWWSYYYLGPHSHHSKEIKSYSWIWPTCPLEVREAFLYELIASLPNVLHIFRWLRNWYKPNNFLNLFQLHKTRGRGGGVCWKWEKAESGYVPKRLTVSLSSKPLKGKKVKFLLYYHLVMEC